MQNQQERKVETMKSRIEAGRKMNACGKGLSLLALVVLLSGVSPAMAGHAVTLPFVAKGTPVSATLGEGGIVYIMAQGHATHLGRYTASAVIANTPGDPPTFDGDITMVAANGDELYFHYSGVTTQIVPIREGEGAYEITGGTGRFEGASGQGSFSSHNNMTLFDGTITLSRGK